MLSVLTSFPFPQLSLSFSFHYLDSILRELLSEPGAGAALHLAALPAAAARARSHAVLLLLRHTGAQLLADGRRTERSGRHAPGDGQKPEKDHEQKREYPRFNLIK